MTRQLDVKPRHREQIERLLRGHLPGVEVWAYGSRVNGRSHEGSDLDLVLRSPGLVKIDPSQLAEFNEAVQESTIPFLVEARDWARLPDSFQREIEREYVVLVEKEERGGAGQWPIMSLREAGVSLIDCEHRTPPAAEHGYPYVAIPQVKDGRIDLNGVRRITREHFDEWTRKANPGSFDVVLSRRCNPGETGFVSEGLKFALGQNLVLLRSDGTKVLKPFLRWLVRGPRWWEQVGKYINVGAVFDSLKCADIPDFCLPIPPLPEQRAIAHILGILDDKIELNRRMNETLEEMARALFKSWFIDFDPVHAKAALKRHAAAQITPPLRGSRQAKGDSPQASRWGDHAAPHPPRRWAEIKRQYSPQTLQRAQALRQNQTNAEGLLWHYLSRKQLAGYRFRRQQPIGPYIADFACLSEKLLIELDGGQHAEQTASDNRRDRFLQEKGYRVLRFWNHEVFENCFGVLESIYAALPHHPPLEGGSKDGSLSGRGSPPPPQPAPGGLASATPPPGGSDWNVERARAYLDGMDPGIAALFPDRFVDLELGEVPEGWGVGALDDMLELLSGGTPKTSVAEYWDGNIPWYTAKDAPPPSDVFVVETARKITQAGIENSAAKILPTGTTIITARGTVGRLACLGIPMTMNQTCYGIRGVQDYPDFFTYMNIRMTVDELQQRTHGTIFDTITRQTFKLIDTVIPPPKLADRFETVVQPIMSHILSNLHESCALTALRDALLPKLVSGEVRVGDVSNYAQ